MSLHDLICGFISLTDAAPLIIAREMGFAEEEGIALSLQREASWSNIRDKLGLSIYPAAHMLTPLAIAMSLGTGPMAAQIDVPYVLNLNGTTLTAATGLSAALRADGARFGDAAGTAQALIRRSKVHPLRIGIPFAHSMHRVLVEYLLKEAEPQALRFTIAPPPLLPDVLAAGEIDMVMVGEPWGSFAVDRGEVEMLLAGASIWSGAPEKALGVRRDWHERNPEVLDALLRAVHRAGEWLARPEAIDLTPGILGQPHYLNCAEEPIERALTGRFLLDSGGRIGTAPHALRFAGPAVCFPWKSASGWIASRVSRTWGVRLGEARRVAEESFRPDLYRRGLAELAIPLPTASAKVEGRLTEPTPCASDRGELILGPDSFFDGHIFDPNA
ncbi:MAG: CmpA/NrtA family ABC transporter substrate-binding protein [Pseudomonadota bacterium]